MPDVKDKMYPGLKAIRDTGKTKEEVIKMINFLKSDYNDALRLIDVLWGDMKLPYPPTRECIEDGWNNVIQRMHAEEKE